MIFYQQAAIADKKLRPDDLKAARWDTAVGTVLTQCLTGAVLIAAAATLASSGVSANLSRNWWWKLLSGNEFQIK
jgi:Mn2+/Fe2+ NRAMP family transporter